MPSFPLANPARTKIQEGFLPALRRTVHHRWLLGLLSLLSLITGYFTARTFGTALWEASQYLVFAGDTKEGVTPEQMFLMALSEAKSPNLIKQVIAEVDPQLSDRTFWRNFSVSAEAQPNQMLLKLKWSDAETARNLLNAFAAPYQKQLKQAQISTFDREGNPVLPSADSLVKLEEEIVALREKKRNELTKQGVTDLAADIAARKGAIGAAEERLRNGEQKLIGVKAMYKETLRQLDELKKYQAKEAERREEEDAMHGLSPNHAQRQSRIRELIAEEKVMIDLVAKLQAKTLEKKELEELIKQGKASPESTLRLSSEISVIKAGLDGNKKTSELYDELYKMDRVFAPDVSRTSGISSPILAELHNKRLHLELDIIAIPEGADYLRKEIDVEKARLAHLAGMEGRLMQMDQLIARREQEHRSLQTEITRLNSNRSLVIPFGEASVTQFPVSSNRQTIFSTIFLSGSAISILAVFLYEWVRGIRRPSDIARSLQMDVRWISANPAHAAYDYRELCRVVRSGGFLAKTVLQIQPLTQNPSTQAKAADAIEGLAAAFTKRGEKVLVVDLCDTGLQSGGLMETLLAPEESIDRWIQPGAESGISRMLAGRQELTPAQLSDPALRACLEKLTATYSVILLQGHGLPAIQEVEALGLATDGLILVSDGDRTIEPDAREALVDVTAENRKAQVLVIV